MTVLGPLPDHVARALRGEPQEPQAAPREECAADSSAYLPPDGCEIDREYTRERVEHVDDDVRRAAGECAMAHGWVHDEINLSGQQINEVMTRIEADREKIEQVIRENAGKLAFDPAGVGALVTAIDPASGPSRMVVTAVDYSAARAVSVPMTIDPATGLVGHVPFKLPCGLAFHGATGRHPAASTEEGNTTNPCREIVIREPVEQVQIESTEGWREHVEQSGREPKPTRVTVAGGSMLDALGFTKQGTRSRCPDCNGSGVLAGFGFGTSENACDRPCPCSPPKDDGPSEWTQTRGRQVGADCHRELWTFTFRKGADERSFDVMAMHGLGTCVTVAGQADRCVVRINGEHCVDMAIARLLCGLRDGSITP